MTLTRGLRPYKHYKPSGCDWINQIPGQWETRRAKYLLRERDEKWQQPTGQLLSVSQYTGVTARKTVPGTSEPDSRSLSLVGYKMVRKSELAVNIMLAWNGSLGVSRFDGVVSPAYCVYRFNNGDPWYYHYLLRSLDLRVVIKQHSRGIVDSRLRLYTDDLYRLRLVVPPLGEQQLIAKYAGQLESQVAAFIRGKTRLIAALLEHRESIVHKLVTRGTKLESTKVCSIDWVGQVPSHWDVVPLKRVLRRLIDCEHKTAPAVDDSPWFVVRTTAVRKGVLDWRGTYCTSKEGFMEWTVRGVPEPGDVIFTREAPAGEACIAPADRKVCLGQRTVLMKVDQTQYDADFLVQMIYSGPPRDRIRLATQGSTVGHFNIDDIGWMPVLKPPLEEQREIVRTIARKTKGIDSAVARAEQEIALIRELRDAVVSDVVTGRLDVRDVAMGLPEPTNTVSEAQADVDPVDDEVMEYEGEVQVEEAEV